MIQFNNNKTQARWLRSEILAPALDLSAINKRLDAVAELLHESANTQGVMQVVGGTVLRSLSELGALCGRFARETSASTTTQRQNERKVSLCCFFDSGFDKKLQYVLKKSKI